MNMFQMRCTWLLYLMCVTSTCISIKLDVFSTNTIYEWAHDVQTTVVSNSEGITSSGNQQCRAIHVHGVIRHGTRNPKVANIENIDALYQKLLANKNSSSFSDMASLQKKHTYDINSGGELIEKGIEEMHGLGRRLGSSFSDLLNGRNLQFVSSRVRRNKVSSKAFYDGLDSVLQNVTRYKIGINDVTMRFWENCYNYDQGVSKNETNFQQLKEYSMTPEFKELANGLESRLGLTIPLESGWLLQGDETVSVTADVYQIYDLCAYEMYIFNDSKWCDLMTDTDRATLEYGKDIQVYYGQAYGHPMNAQTACPLLKDIFNTMDTTIQNTHNYSQSGQDINTQHYIAGKFQFGHFETHVPLLTALELFKDAEPLLATNRVYMTNRQFRTSLISPYAANIVFVLYACDNVNDTTMMKIMVNEQAVVIPACGQEICPYEQVKTYYKHQIDACDLQTLCGVKPNGGPSIVYSWSLMIAALVLYMLFKHV